MDLKSIGSEKTRMEFLLQNNIIIVKVRRVSVMLKVFLNHFVCNIPSTPNSISNSPKMSTPISFAKTGVLFLKTPRCSTLQSLNKITNALRRAILNMDVNMVFTDNTFKNSHIFSITNLLNQISAPNLNISLENLKTIFCDPNYMCGQNRYSVPHSSLLFHPPKLRNCVATESLALKVHSFN